MKYRAIVQEKDGWWIGWLVEIPGVNTQEKTRGELINMVIRFTDLCLISSIILISAAVNVLTTDRFDIHRLLNKPIEQLTMIPKGSMAPTIHIL